jgi:hypothetical protein
MQNKIVLILVLLVSICTGCQYLESSKFEANFDDLNDRIWIGEDFWSIPLEDWKVKDGRLECVGDRPNMRVNIISRKLAEKGDLEININLGLLSDDEAPGSAGFALGLKDNTDNSVKSLCYFGKGLNVGIHTAGYLYAGDHKEPLPEGFSLASFKMHVTVKGHADNLVLSMLVTDINGNEARLLRDDLKEMDGLMAIVNNYTPQKKQLSENRFWFDDLSISGSRVIKCEDQKFGPVLWTMYTQSKGKLKLSAQFPPIGQNDNQWATLQLKKQDAWESVKDAEIDTSSYTALFALPWKEEDSVAYRIKYVSQSRSGNEMPHYYHGMIRKEPKDSILRLAGLTCQEGQGFPYSPLVKNLAYTDPDILFFSGDQIYEQNGGYSILRTPIDKSIINYLGKWYMFGWAFGEAMKDRPTVCLPDDHDVFQGNLWGNAGQSIGQGQNGGGYVMSPEMVNVVHKTQCSHLPDPVDPMPIADGISVYFTEMVYGKVSFAIVSDRMFKSSPDEVASWSGRSDHLKRKLKNTSELEKPGLKMLGERQLAFLDEWSTNWQGVYMKVLLSQTMFANVATHHGRLKGFLQGDLDSGGWPRSGRNEILKRLRACNAFHICGDQHLPSFVQYGIDNYRDANWVFCTPAIYVGYERRFQPDLLDWPIVNRPDHNLPNTGNYTDAFGNPSFVYAVGQYADNTKSENRYLKGLKTTSGFGLVTFNTASREIKAESIKFLAELQKAPDHVNQHDGWPCVIHQFENTGILPYQLPLISSDEIDPVVEITHLNTGQLITSVRIKGKEFQPMVPYPGKYVVKLFNPEGKNVSLVQQMAAVKRERIQ